MAKITQHALANQLGVSRSTVAAALNPGSTIKLNEATRERILRAAERLNYRPDRYARVMRGGRSGLIGILHFGGLLQAAAERAYFAANAVRERNFEVIPVIPADLSWSVESIQAACASMLDARVEGVVVAGLNDPGAAACLERLHLAGIPMVALSGKPLPWASHFRADTRQAVLELTRHLIANGHRRLSLIAHLSTTRNDPGASIRAGSERLSGFAMALKEAGGTLVPHFTKRTNLAGKVVSVDLPRNRFDPFGPGIEGMQAILKDSVRDCVRPTAVICSNDELAYGALAVCRAHGFSVPGEIALTGHDDTALGRYCEVPLTTVRQPNQTMAEAAVASLIDLIEGRQSPPGKMAKTKQPVLFPCELIFRESSGVHKGT